VTPLPPWVKQASDGVLLALKVQPRASRVSIGPALGAELKLAVTAPPVDSAANEAVLEALVDCLGCPRGAVQLIRGQTSRHKVVRVVGLSAETVAQRLQNRV